MDRQQLKQTARDALGNQIFNEYWIAGVVVSLVYGVIFSVASVTYVGDIILLGPLLSGFSYVVMQAVRSGEKMDVGEFFSKGFENFGAKLLLGLMQTIFLSLWTLLFCIPGIIKSYSYSMAFFIQNDNPEYGWKECIDASREMMDGHKMDLFILDLSFLGWYIVGSLVLGIGTLWVTPYHMAARAAFYEELNGATYREM